MNFTPCYPEAPVGYIYHLLFLSSLAGNSNSIFSLSQIPRHWGLVKTVQVETSRNLRGPCRKSPTDLADVHERIDVSFSIYSIRLLEKGISAYPPKNAGISRVDLPNLDDNILCSFKVDSDACFNTYFLFDEVYLRYPCDGMLGIEFKNKAALFCSLSVASNFSPSFKTSSVNPEKVEE